MPAPTSLRTICTVPLTPGHNPHDPALWERVFRGWQVRWLPGSEPGADVERAVALVKTEDQAQVRRGALVYARWPQADLALPALVNLTDDRQFVTVRVFATYLTEVQRLAEQLTEAMLRESAFDFGPGVRVSLAISVGGVRADLTSGRVQVRHGSALKGFYDTNKYALNTTLVVLISTLLIFVLVTPDGNFTPLDKFYGLMERILSAVLLNSLLLASQFLFFARHRRVIDWEKP
ncbi:hypothetical protein GCM10022631_03820 [Deinococcus rubellus]|uniref:Uncharacterized protein n=1 Tax=Deinococcus rubellus TaxID=1889240 RepID=A0ABY5YG03_9DEIO|nr:hypothetical protein [Deinococcus rubellus]UWX63322.1 hypothetical protein N0D28_11255 [Deinococcus rubellus]